jgi:signal transduction histidine kinase
MPVSSAVGGKAQQRSVLDSFFDDYQLVRLAMVLGGLAHLTVFAWGVRWEFVVPYVIGLVLTGTHAAWCRLHRVHSPRSMLLLDVTLWGAVMVRVGEPIINTALFAFLAVITVVFAHGRLMVGFLSYASAWYAISHFGGRAVTLDSLGIFLAVVLITGGLAGLMLRVSRWLGRLEANRSQMLGTVSHELRNNLTGAMGLTEIVSTDPTLSRQEAVELVSLAHQQAVDASEIVEDLLVATRAERSALSVTTEAVDVNREVATTARRFSGDGVNLVVETCDELPAADADSLRVRQILRNLVSNAVRYGGSSIRLTTFIADDTICIVVADDGDGVPVEDEKTIFLPYRRSSRPQHSASVGLGLWISRELAHAMGGTLDYRRIDAWTEFVLTLRIHSAADRPGRDRRVRGAVNG